MKNLNASKDKSGSYRTFSFNKISAPSKADVVPRATKTVGKTDLRGGNK